MAVKIFISYRRSDSAGFALLIHQRLAAEFGRDLLFIDVDSIGLGRDFAQVIRGAVAKCGVLLALLGPKWVDVRAADGKRRLDDSKDFVRIEIAAALKRHIRVIPILFDNATMPKYEELPRPLKRLAHCQAHWVRHDSFKSDIENLVQNLGALDPGTFRLEARHLEIYELIDIVSIGELVSVLERPHLLAGDAKTVLKKGRLMKA